MSLFPSDDLFPSDELLPDTPLETSHGFNLYADQFSINLRRDDEDMLMLMAYAVRCFAHA